MATDKTLSTDEDNGLQLKALEKAIVDVEYILQTVVGDIIGKNQPFFI